MALTSRKRDLARLERELRDVCYEELLRSLRERRQAFKPFSTWDDVLTFFRKRNVSETEKNELLQSLVEVYQADRNNPWSTVLLAVFWLVLESVHIQRRHWDADDDERWQKTIEIFLLVLRQFDLNRRKDRLLSRIVNNTVHNLHSAYRKGWRVQNLFEQKPLDELIELAGGRSEAAEDLIGWSDARNAELRRLKKHLKLKRINEEDFNLLVATRIHGLSVKDYAAKVGRSYQTLKKRRQRAEARLRLSRG